MKVALTVFGTYDNSKYKEDIDKYLRAIEEVGEYKPTYRDQIAEATQKLGNWDETYNPETDPTYQQYKADYTRYGRQAMDDTLGKISARTGGLASSYAMAAANQTYNEYMKDLAAKIPALSDAARGRVQDSLSAYRALENDLQGDWSNRMSYNQNMYNFYKGLADEELAEQKAAATAARYSYTPPPKSISLQEALEFIRDINATNTYNVTLDNLKQMLDTGMIGKSDYDLLKAQVDEWRGPNKLATKYYSTPSSKRDRGSS